MAHLNLSKPSVLTKHMKMINNKLDKEEDTGTKYKSLLEL